MLTEMITATTRSASIRRQAGKTGYSIFSRAAGGGVKISTNIA
jgi:hypothetical protein